jgi:hypothetical protein
MRQILLVSAVVGLLLGSGSPANADTIMISTPGAGPVAIPPSDDSVTLNPDNHTYNLPHGVLTVVALQPGVFHVGNSPGLVALLSFTISESITINGDTRTVMFPGTNDVTLAVDTLSFQAGPPVVFSTAILTPQAQPNIASGAAFSDNNFTFMVGITPTGTAIPEPSSLALAALGVLGLVAMRRKRAQSPS